MTANFREYANFIWGVADLIRDSFKRGKYQDVILPLTVLRRIDCVLEPTKRKVLDVNAKLKGKLENRDPQLRKASGFAFYNTSRYDFARLLADAPGLAVPAPPLVEQQAIAAFLDRETAKIDALISKVRQAVEKLREYRAALISSAVTGKIDVPETAA